MLVYFVFCEGVRINLTSQPGSTVISLFSNLIITKVQVAVLMLLTLHCWAMPPVLTITDAPILGVLVAGKDCFYN